MATDSVTEPPKCHKCGEQEGEEKYRRCGRCKTTPYCSRDCQTADWSAHRPSCKRPNYLLKVHLCPDNIEDPAVTRVLSCPATATFADLHEALQIAFQWAGTHAYDFAVHNPNCDREGDYESIEELMNFLQFGPAADSQPKFDLRIVEKEEGKKGPFAGFGHVDKMHEKHRMHPKTPEKPSHKVRLYQIFEDPKYTGRIIEYMYDFGDNWRHRITVKGRADASDEFSCVDGTGHYVAEDVKQQGWKDLKEAYRAEDPDHEQGELMHWFEYQASNADPLGLGNGREHEWDKDFVNVGLETIHISK